MPVDKLRDDTEHDHAAEPPKWARDRRKGDWVRESEPGSQDWRTGINR